MVKCRLAFKRSFLGQTGQSTVEYILLLAVVVIAVNTVFKSKAFQSIFGENGKFSKEFRGEAEYSYRHAIRGRKLFREPNYARKHDSYIQSGSSTRFFGAKEPYPKK